MRDGSYPSGADFDRDAPYNEVKHTPVNIDVDIVVTMSKRVRIAVNDYDVNEDDCTLSFEDSDMYGHVKKQVELPQNICEGWTVDDFQIIY